MIYFYSYRVTKPGFGEVYAQGHGLIKIKGEVDGDIMTKLVENILAGVRENHIDPSVIPENAGVILTAFNQV